VWEGGSKKRHFSNNSTMKQYFKMLSFTRRCVFLAFSLLQCQSSPISFLHAVTRKNTAYIVNRAYFLGAKSGRQVSIDYTPFYRQHLCGGQCTQEQSRPQQNTWNSKLFVFFSAEITAAQSLHFQHLMWTEVMSSRRL